MKRLTTLTLAVVVGLGFGLAATAQADWFPGDGHKMHYPQLPDLDGWDVNFEGPLDPGTGAPAKMLADDWQCTATGPVSDIHFWFSTRQDVDPFLLLQGAWLNISIYSNNPAGPNGYSIPDQLLWYERVPIDPAAGVVQIIPWPETGAQGFYDPNTAEVIPNDHALIWQANLPEIVNPFFQQQGEVYWLGLNIATPASQPGFAQLGWKTSEDHFMDDAVWIDAFTGLPIEPDPALWNELIDPITGTSMDLAFVITPEPTSLTLIGLGGLALLRRRR